MKTLQIQRNPDFVHDLLNARIRFDTLGSLHYIRTLLPLADGRYYAFIQNTKTRKILRARGFRTRWQAKVQRNQWWSKRNQALQNVRVAASNRRRTPTRLEQAQRNLRDAETHLRLLDSRVKRLRTYRTKALRRLRGLQTHVRRLEEERP